jgi:nitrite reductase/ring-hydroxylating ferredoxin subunit
MRYIAHPRIGQAFLQIQKQTNESYNNDGHNNDTKKIEIALFNKEGKFYAIPNRFTHEGGPLSGGVLEWHIVTCPWHAWKYSVIDGKASHEGEDSVSSYETKVIGDRVYVNSGSLM